MKADPLNSKDLFGRQVTYLIPPFQRPYVWNQDDQWEPLWDDVQEAADRYLDALAELGEEGSPAEAEKATGHHFLGAIVVKQVSTAANEIEAREVIDGQQRITTLQLLIDAAQEVAELQGWEDTAYNLRHLVRNDEYFAKKNPERIYKVWPTLQDRPAFEAAMTNGAPILAFRGSSIVDCHEYFKLRVTDWVSQVVGPDPQLARIQALETALVGLLEVVVIDLGSGDDAFVIFETLNARGTPLRASDLVKNYLIQRASSSALSPDAVSASYWSQFEDAWWQREVRQGRLLRPRVDTFLDYWLEARSGDEVQSYEVFPTFQRLVEKDPTKVLEHAQSMKDAAGVFRAIEEMDRYTRDGTFLYRWDVLDARVLTPLLLWVFSLDPTVLAPERRTRLLVGLESFLVRRAVGRMTTKQYNRLFLEILKRARLESPEIADDVVLGDLAGQTADSTAWPTDAEFRQAILDLPVYSLLTRGRVRMVLEAIEDHLRDAKTEDQHVTRGSLTIEHVLPQTWLPHWPLAESDDPLRAEIDRNRLLHTFGNLTLATSALNPELSNGPWSMKRPKLGENSVLKLTKRILDAEQWDEVSIRAQGSFLAEKAMEIWPRP
jgi:hypothetical protein